MRVPQCPEKCRDRLANEFWLDFWTKDWNNHLSRQAFASADLSIIFSEYFVRMKLDAFVRLCSFQRQELINVFGAIIWTPDTKYW